MPSVDSPGTLVIASGLTEDDIARRAFELYCDRGREDGHDVDDRLNAERELRHGEFLRRLRLILSEGLCGASRISPRPLPANRIA
jgi:Protein of unknown function (DUF2934)